MRRREAKLPKEVEDVLKQQISRNLINVRNVHFDHPETNLANVLFVGLSGSGKSSLIRAIDTMFLGRQSWIVDAGTGTDQVTDTLRKLSLKPTGNRMKRTYNVTFPADDGFPFRIWDTMGWSTQAYLHGELAYILDGNLPEGFRFNRQGTVTPNAQGFNSNPRFNEKVHCVVAILSINQACTDENMGRIRDLLSLTRMRGLRTLLLLTQIDKIDPQLRDCPHLAYESEKVQAVIEKVQSCGIPQGDIFPIKNYFHEKRQPTMQVEYLLSNFLESLAYCCEDYFRNEKQIADARPVPDYNRVASKSKPRKTKESGNDAQSGNDGEN